MRRRHRQALDRPVHARGGRARVGRTVGARTLGLRALDAGARRGLINFVMDWDGDKNRTGITSEPGQNFWLARALVATQTAGWAFGDSDAIEAYRRGLSVAAADEAPPDIRSLHLVTALFGDDPEPSLARRWADEIAACRDGDVLKNSPYEVGAPHLWAHIQEGALALASTTLETRAARRRRAQRRSGDRAGGARSVRRGAAQPCLRRRVLRVVTRSARSCDTGRALGPARRPTHALGSTVATPQENPSTTGNAEPSPTGSTTDVSR